MGWLSNGSNGRSGEGVSRTPQPELVSLENALAPKHTSRELARFLPVMDIDQAVARREVMVQAMKRLMKEDVDYGTIPGTAKPTLLQPGADKLANLFGLTLKYDFLEKIEDWSGGHHEGEPFFYYQVRAQVFRDEFLIGEGVGSCSSWESKYRWRKAERLCPSCGKANIRKSRDGGWYCWMKTDGCGQVFNDGDPAIVGQETGRKKNPDICDSINTILKIAYKRAKLSGTINATSASEFFTQDLETEDFSVEEPIDIGGRPRNSASAAQYVAEQKIKAGSGASRNVPWKNMREMAECFKAMRERVGEVVWNEELGRYGWSGFQQMKSAYDAKGANAKEKIIECYWHLDAREAA